jgi:multidrug efflux pump subunit AcrA (membrane-fusion protein)
MVERIAIVKSKLPEEQELDKKLKELGSLENILAQLELDLATRQEEVRVFELRYLTLVGKKMAMLDILRARVAELLSKQRPGDQVAKQEAKQARAQAKESNRAYSEAATQPAESTSFTPNESLKSLFREAAKRCHPDLASDERDAKLRTRVMAEINDAYKVGDEKRLRKILQEWETSPEAVQGDDVGARLIRTIRQISLLQKRMKDIRSMLIFISETDIYKLMDKCLKAEKVGRDMMQEMVAHLDDEIRQVQTQLDELQVTKGKGSRKKGLEEYHS